MRFIILNLNTLFILIVVTIIHTYIHTVHTLYIFKCKLY